MRLTNIIDGMKHYNDESLSRPILESIVSSEVQQALTDWIKSTNNPGLLIGGLAVSFYGRPRATMDVDVLYITDNEIPRLVDGFKKNRGHAFIHLKTHVDIEVLSADFLGIPSALVQKIKSNAKISNGVSIPDKGGLVALKLFRITSNAEGPYDEGDIKQLILTGNVNLEPYIKWLSQEQQEIYNRLNQQKK